MCRAGFCIADDILSRTTPKMNNSLFCASDNELFFRTNVVKPEAQIVPLFDQVMFSEIVLCKKMPSAVTYCAMQAVVDYLLHDDR